MTWQRNRVTADKNTVMRKALSAAAGVTGVLKRSGPMVATGLTVSAMAACGAPQKEKQPVPAPEPVKAEAPNTTKADASDSAPTNELPPNPRWPGEVCADDPGPGSDCCQALAEKNDPKAYTGNCTPWGPPAPPVYRGEVLA